MKKKKKSTAELVAESYQQLIVRRGVVTQLAHDYGKYVSEISKVLHGIKMVVNVEDYKRIRMSAITVHGAQVMTRIETGEKAS